MTFSKILVPVDGSDMADRALPYAVRLAAAAHGGLVLLRAVPRDARRDKDEHARLEAAQRHLERAAARVRAEGIPVEHAIYHDMPPEAVVRAVRSYRTDLIAMTTHARSEFKRWYLGSVADDVVRSTESPVLLIPPECVREWTGQERSGDCFVLVPLDGSGLASEALAPAIQLAAALGCGLRLLHVVQPAGGGDGRYFAEEDPAVRAAAARQLLEEEVARVHAHGLKAEVETITGYPAQTIATEGARKDVLAVAMSTHGRGGVIRTVMGSTATGVLLRTCVPMLVVRSQAAGQRTAAGSLDQVPAESSEAVTLTLEPRERKLVRLALSELLSSVDPGLPLAEGVRALMAKLSKSEPVPACIGLAPEAAV